LQSISLSELLEWKETRKYWCYPFLPIDGTMFFAAPPKHLKTLLAMQFAYSLAAGTDFLGFKVSGPVERILYVEQEIGRAETRDRMSRMHKMFTDVEALKRIRFITKPKQRFSLDAGSKGLKLLEEEIIEYQPQIIFIDPMRKITSSDENSSTEMTKVFATLTMLQETYGFAVIIVHHSGKPNDNRRSGTPEAMRGSSEIFAHGDTYGMLVKSISGNDLDIDVHWTFRASHPIDPIKLTYTDNGIFKRRQELPKSISVKLNPVVNPLLKGIKIENKD